MNASNRTTGYIERFNRWLYRNCMAHWYDEVFHCCIFCDAAAPNPVSKEVVCDPLESIFAVTHKSDCPVLVAYIRCKWLVFLLAICLMIGTCFLEAPAQDKYKEARKRLSTPEIVLPDIDIKVQPDTLALRLFIQAQAADTLKHTIREVKE